MSGAPLGLYPSKACVPAQRLNAGASLALDVPVAQDGGYVFRRSLWLPLPAAAADAQALRWVASALKVRFATANIVIETGRTEWFSRVHTSDNRTVRLELVWPAAVSRIHSPAGYDRIDMTLHRADGEHVVEEATQTGKTDTTLLPPWVGSPLVIRLAQAIVAKSKLKKPAKKAAGKSGAGSAAEKLGAGDSSLAVEKTEALILLGSVVQSHVVPQITVVGKPNSPRLRLALEARGAEPEKLLWQALAPGEQATADLPAGALADEWAGALEQVAKALATPVPDAPLRLRLDVESDAPCTATLQQAAFGLEGDFALLDAPRRLDFDGARAAVLALTLDRLPAGVTALELGGLLDGAERTPPADAPLPAGGRVGVLCEPDQLTLRRMDLAAPAALGGVALGWHPLTERLTGRLAVLGDGGSGPAARALVEQPFSIETPTSGWIALRWPALDLQPRALWLRLALDEGAGLWLADPQGLPAPGWQERPGTAAGARAPLGLAPLCAWLEEPLGDATPAASLHFVSGAHEAAPQRTGKRFGLTLPGSTLGTDPASAIQVRCTAPARLIVESAEATVRIG